MQACCTGRLPALLVLALLLAAPLPSHAQDGGVNPTQRGVPAEATAENGVVARERALIAGRRAAWDRLLNEAGLTGPSPSDSQLEAMTQSIIIEQERSTPTRYIGQITVNFIPSRVRALIGNRVAATPGGATPGQPGVANGPPPLSGPASTWVEAVATYGGMQEWVDVLRRLKASPTVASVEIRGVAVDAARLRVGLRVPPAQAAGDLAGRGLAVQPVSLVIEGAASGGAGRPAWRLVLGSGG